MAAPRPPANPFPLLRPRIPPVPRPAAARVTYVPRRLDAARGPCYLR